MTAAEAVIASLEIEGVDRVFGYPGGQALALYDALYQSSLTHVLARHEQGAVHEADGYARASGRVGVCLVTSGPGATNTVTGIATAYMDSVPLVVITAQVPRRMIGTDSFQESDIVGITIPVVKHSFLLQSVNDVTQTMAEALYIAQAGRPGPVLIDVPSDLAAERMVFEYPSAVTLPSYKPTFEGNKNQIRLAASLMKSAERPVIIAGGGCEISRAGDVLLTLARTQRIPVATTLMGKGVFPEDDALSLGMAGMHGAKYTNHAITESDLIIAVGVRFSDRLTGRIDKFAPHAALIHIDIDPAEIGKMLLPRVPIVGDARNVLSLLNEECANPRNSLDALHVSQRERWLAEIAEWKQRYPYFHPRLNDVHDEIVPEIALSKLSEMLDPATSVIVTDVGQHQMWAAQSIVRTHPCSFLTSGGLGTMGFGLPAAIGACFAQPHKQVVCITGDGSFQMNVQEMATAAIHHLPLKVVIMDNRCLGMVHQWQRLFYGERYAATNLDEVPDFLKLADAYGWCAESVSCIADVEAAFTRMLASESPYLIDMRISREQNVYPMVMPGTSLDNAIGTTEIGTTDIANQNGEEGVRRD